MTTSPPQIKFTKEELNWLRMTNRDIGEGHFAELMYERFDKEIGLCNLEIRKGTNEFGAAIEVNDYNHTSDIHEQITYYKGLKSGIEFCYDLMLELSKDYKDSKK